MTRPILAWLTLAALSLISAQPAGATPGDVTLYTTVDAIKVVGKVIEVTGIVVGQSAPSATFYSIANSDVVASRCDRLALLAMSKPGKFQLAMVEETFDFFSCKLIVRTP